MWSYTWRCQCISNGSRHLRTWTEDSDDKSFKDVQYEGPEQLLTQNVCRLRLPVAAEYTREDICHTHPVFMLLPKYILPALLETGCWVRGRFSMTEAWLTLCCQHAAEFCSLGKLLLTISGSIITSCVYALLAREQRKVKERLLSCWQGGRQVQPPHATSLPVCVRFISFLSLQCRTSKPIFYCLFILVAKRALHRMPVAI